MEMTIETQPANIAIVHMQGKLDLLSTANVKQRLSQVVSEGSSKLVIDMSNVTFIDSSGLAALVSALKTTRLASGDLRLACLSEEARNIFEITRLDRVIQSYETVEDAIESFR